MPWEQVLGGLTGGAAAAVTLAVLYARGLMDFLFNRAAKEHEALLTRHRDNYLSALGTAAKEYELTLKSKLAAVEERHRKSLEVFLAEAQGAISRLQVAQSKLVELGGIIDLNLHRHRVRLYPELWELTGILPGWPRALDVTYEEMLKVSEAMKDWYFRKGGMYLSRESRDVYVNLQKQIHARLRRVVAGGEAIVPQAFEYLSAGKAFDKPVSTKDYTEVYQFCSILRTQLTVDLQSRRPAVAIPYDSGAGARESSPMTG